MIICPENPETYQRLFAQYEHERQSNTPKELRSYIERNHYPPIHAFLNLSMRNHQGAFKRIGHVALSLQTPIQLDLLAWLDEQPNTAKSLKVLRDQLMVDVVTVAESRKLKALSESANESRVLRSVS